MVFNANFFFSVTTVCIIITLSGLCNMENSQYILRSFTSRAKDVVYGQISDRNVANGTSNTIIKESLTTNGKENVYNINKVGQNENQTNNATRYSIKDSKGIVEKDKKTKVILKRNITRVNKYPHLFLNNINIRDNNHLDSNRSTNVFITVYCVGRLGNQMRIVIYPGDISF